MLVLSRHEEQEIYIDIDGKQLRIVVLEIRGERVRLGLEAPSEFRIRRGELIDEEYAA